ATQPFRTAAANTAANQHGSTKSAERQTRGEARRWTLERAGSPKEYEHAHAHSGLAMKELRYIMKAYFGEECVFLMENIKEWYGGGYEFCGVQMD
ncbi:hypothetical protein LTR54_018151, partial [Friedmanniomyces endolithicus]